MIMTILSTLEHILFIASISIILITVGLCWLIFKDWERGGRN